MACVGLFVDADAVLACVARCLGLLVAAGAAVRAAGCGKCGQETRAEAAAREDRGRAASVWRFAKGRNFKRELKKKKRNFKRTKQNLF